MKDRQVKSLDGNTHHPNQNGVKYISIHHIIANPDQPRKKFDDHSLQELKESILQYGLLQPIIVRKINDGNFELIAGERRWRASKLAGLQTIPALVKAIDDKMMAEIALIENVQRENLSVVDEALAYKLLIDRYQYTQEQLSQRIGKSQPFIANKLRLLKLPSFILQELNLNYITERHARALLKVKDPQQQLEYLKEIIDHNLTVKETEEIISNDQNQIISQVIIKKHPPQKSKSKAAADDFHKIKKQVDRSFNKFKKDGFKVNLNQNINEDTMEIHIIIKKP